MQWFGESWGAHVCEGEHVATPVGAICFGSCAEPIVEGDRGVVLPFLGFEGIGNPSPDAPYHLECLLYCIFHDPRAELAERAARVRAGESEGKPADEVFDRLCAKENTPNPCGHSGQALDERCDKCDPPLCSQCHQPLPHHKMDCSLRR